MRPLLTTRALLTSAFCKCLFVPFHAHARTQTASSQYKNLSVVLSFGMAQSRYLIGQFSRLARQFHVNPLLKLAPLYLSPEIISISSGRLLPIDLSPERDQSVNNTNQICPVSLFFFPRPSPLEDAEYLQEGGFNLCSIAAYLTRNKHGETEPCLLNQRRSITHKLITARNKPNSPVSFFPGTIPAAGGL